MTLLRLLYGRNPDHIEDPAPFASDVRMVFLGIALFFLAILFPRVGLPLFGLFVFLLVLGPVRRLVARRR